MKSDDIIRAWKDPVYRASLKDAPASPAGLVELEDVALESVAGGNQISITDSETFCTVSGWELSCGYVCTLTTECTCRTLE